MLNDFAQLQANVSVLSMFKVGQAPIDSCLKRPALNYLSPDPKPINFFSSPPSIQIVKVAFSITAASLTKLALLESRFPGHLLRC